MIMYEIAGGHIHIFPSEDIWGPGFREVSFAEQFTC